MAETITARRARRPLSKEDLTSLLQEDISGYSFDDPALKSTLAETWLGSSAHRYFLPSELYEYDFSSNSRIEESRHYATEIASSVTHSYDAWNKIYDELKLTEQRPIAISNSRTDWSPSYAIHEGDFQDHITVWLSVPGIGESARRGFGAILACVKETDTRYWADLIQHFKSWEHAFAHDLEGKRFASRLIVSFEIDSVEDGIQHSAEEIIAEAFKSEHYEFALEWLGNFCTDDSQPNFAASVLRCLGRIDNVGTATWRADLVRDALATHNSEIRDAAVQAVETWGDVSLTEVLQSHSESELWLRQYIADVLDDLAG